MAFINEWLNEHFLYAIPAMSEVTAISSSWIGTFSYTVETKSNLHTG
jgi:hypothetical protein